MERSKIRETDNLRTFYLSRFFIEYLLLLRHKESRENNGKSKENRLSDEVHDELALGLVAEMAEMESVRWVFTRMRSTMDDKVCILTVSDYG
jgi:replication fork protection complex subunit Tof1/Swi1